MELLTLCLLCFCHVLNALQVNFSTPTGLVRWGFEAPFGGAVIHGRYDLTAEYLSNSTGLTVEVVPVVDDLELAVAAGNGSLQMLQTGSGLYTCVEAEHGFVPFLNTVEPHAGRNVTDVAGIIFARADDRTVNSVADIRGRVVATGPFLYLSTFQSQWSYLLDQGIDFFSEASAVLISTNPSTAVVDVASGKYPIGWTRAGLPEDLQAAGSLQQGLLKILDVKNLSGFPYATTTQRFPGNKISVSPNMSTNVQRMLMTAFLDIPPSVASVGQYTNYIPSLPTTETLNMQNNIGLLQFPLKRCSSLTNAYTAVTCPVGFEKSSEASVMENCRTQGIDCPTGYTCYCRPCIRVMHSTKIGRFTKTGFIVCLTIVFALFFVILVLTAFFLRLFSSKLIRLADFVSDSTCGLSGLGPVYSGRYKGQSVVCKTVYEPPQRRFRITSIIQNMVILRYMASAVILRMPKNESNICDVIGCGLDKNKVVVIMSLYTMGNLSDLLYNPTADIPLSLTLRYVETLLQIVQRFHRLTPAKYGQIYDTGDFLISHEHGLVYSPGGFFFFDQDEHKRSSVKAPEIVLGGQVSEQSDMWTAGLLLYEILHRRPAFDDLEIDDITASMQKGVVRIPIIQQLYDVDALYDIVRSCLQKEPMQRPALADCLSQVRQIASIIPDVPADIPPHLISAMQGDKVVTTDVYKKVSLICCETDDFSVFDLLNEVADSKQLCVIPTAEHYKNYFVAAETLTDEHSPQHTPPVYKILSFLREVCSKHDLLSFGLHCGDLRGTIIGERYCFVGPTMSALRELQNVARSGEILCSEHALCTKGISNVELSPRTGLIKCRGQVPFRAMYAKLR